jgi:hypothetical protein
MSDLIKRADAIEAVRMSEHRITIADEQGGVGTVKWDMWGVYTAEAVEAIKALTSAEGGDAEMLNEDFRPKYMQQSRHDDGRMTREETIKWLESLKAEIGKSEHRTLWHYAEAIDMAIEALSAEAEDRLYIKIYADDEPSVKAEKLYQICGETQNREVTEWLKEYFPSAEPKTGGWLPCTKNGLILTELIRKEDVAKWYGYKCSECNYIYRGNALIECSYCPNCGARMNGEDGEV